LETKKYRIRVETFKGNILIFSEVEGYEKIAGSIQFTDSKTGLERSYPIKNCEIEEIKDEG